MRKRRLAYGLTLLPIPAGLCFGMRDWGLMLLEPVTMLLAQVLCVKLAETGDGRNKKVNGLVLWLMPIISNFCFFLSYALNRGARFSVLRLMVGFLGLMMLVIGNYLPKCRQNSFVGIRVSWTLGSENNWNATHRMAGPVWVVLGAVMLGSAAFSEEVCMAVMLLSMTLMVLIPLVYSYRYYRRECREGTPRKAVQTDKRMTRLAAIIVVAVLALSALLVFTGSVHMELGEASVKAGATYYSGLTIPYDSIRSCELRQADVPGIRVFGLGSFRLLCGQFRNEEFGDYTRYTVYKPSAVVVLGTDAETIVLSGNSREETEELYHGIFLKMNPDFS